MKKMQRKDKEKKRKEKKRGQACDLRLSLTFDHPEGASFARQFPDGLWYHVVVEFPKETKWLYLGTSFERVSDPTKPTPSVSVHCHGTNPMGWRHVWDRIRNGRR